MKKTIIATGIITALGVVGCNNSNNPADETATVTSVEFIGMNAPSTAEQRSNVYTEAKVKVNYSDGTSNTQDLKYNQLFATGDSISGKTVGGLYDSVGNPLLDSSVPANTIQYVAETPDANSLMSVPGANATALNVSGNPLFMVTHYEYINDDNTGVSQYGDLPMAMSLTTIDQDKTTGALTTVDYKNIDMSGIKGLWIPCAGSLSPWNTHLGSEEYEPDARAYEADPNTPKTADPYTPMTVNYYQSTTTALPYDYGHVPEVTVAADGTSSVVKHYSMGRFARELVSMMPDQRTGYMGDDGSYTGLFMYIADTAGDLTAGTIYAAKWTQTSAENAGTADLTWVKLGHGTDVEIKTLAENTVFSSIFDVSDVDPVDATYTLVKTDKGTEWLRLKPGMEQAAAFLETRRYAAYLGATTEFTKMEGVTVNPADKKAYVAMSRIYKGMTSIATDPVDDIQLTESRSGAVYELSLNEAQNDTDGNAIDSGYVATVMKGLVIGEDIVADSIGNISNDDKIANPDNIKFSEKARTLFIGEDSGRHVNNYVWAYNVDTGALSRILSVPAGAEATGLQAVDNLNGFAYVMSNFQHPGDFIKTMDTTLKAEVEPLIDSKWSNKEKAAIGYISGMPALK